MPRGIVLLDGNLIAYENPFTLKKFSDTARLKKNSQVGRIRFCMINQSFLSRSLSGFYLTHTFGLAR